MSGAGAQQWTTEEQRVYLYDKLAAYLTAQDQQNEASLSRFWGTLNTGWFERWPEEPALGLPIPVLGTPAVPMTDDQLMMLGKATQKTKDRLKTWMRYRERRHRNGAAPSAGPPPATNRKTKRFLFRLLKRTKATRPLRAVEMYQKMFGAKIKAEVLLQGYGLLNEEVETERAAAEAAEAAAAAGHVDVRVLNEAETKDAELQADLIILARVRKNRSARMKLYISTSSQLYAGESAEIKAQVEAATAEYNAKRSIGSADADDDAERTPEEYQHAIDQLNHVLAKVTETVMLETGWVGMVLLGGPMPRRGGQISAKTFCFGQTAHGNDYQGSHPNFDENVKLPFVKFVKRCFPHEVRDARGIAASDEEISTGDADPMDSLIAFAVDDNDVEGKPQPPKRIRHKPRAAAAILTPSTVTEPLVPNALALAPLPVPVSPAYNDPLLAAVSAENTTLPHPAAPDTLANFDDIMESMEDTNFSMVYDEADIGTFDYHAAMPTLGDHGKLTNQALVNGPAEPLRPAPRPMYQGGFEKDREVGELTYIEHLPVFPRPSTLLQAFGRRRAAVTLTVPPTIPSAAQTSITSRDDVLSPMPPLSTLGRALPATPAAEVGSPAGSSTPSPPPSTLGAAPPPRPLGLASFRPRPSPLATFTAMVVRATAAAHEERGEATPSVPIHPAAPALPALPTAPSDGVPQYIQSRPAANVPKGHPLAPATKQRNGLEAARAARSAKAAKKGRGRPRKIPAPAPGPGPVNESAPPATAPGPVENAAPAMTDTARAETGRINQEAAAQRKTSAEMRTRAKALEDKAAADAAQAKLRQAALHNPAGDHDLFVTKARPQRAQIATKNFDGSNIIRPKKRTRAEMAVVEDAQLVARFKERKDAPPPKK
ncbi:hypothetical protein B0H19DRAFT_1262406 [Mycena capillaripes]|nr:hypothetical protein B0H19DRAFT_1262406 [Mycena capillaripes]